MVKHNSKTGRKAEKERLSKEYMKSGSGYLGLPGWKKAAELDLDNSPTAWGWEASRFGSRTHFEKEVLGMAELSQLRKDRLSEHSAEALARALERNWSKLVTRYFFKLAGFLVRPATQGKKIQLYANAPIHTPAGKQVFGFKLIQPGVTRIEELLKICSEAEEKILDDLAKFEKEAQYRNTLSWLNSDGEELPTYLADLLKDVHSKIQEILRWVESGLNEFGELGDLETELNILAIEQGRKARGKYKNFLLHGWAPPDSYSHACAAHRAEAEKLRGNIPLTTFNRPSDFAFHRPGLIDELISWLPGAEAETVKLAVGRAALGNCTDINRRFQDLSGWRYAILFDSDPGVGKSRFISKIDKGLEAYGLEVATIPGRLDAGFGFGVFAGNAVISDDMSPEQFKALSRHGMIKTALSGGKINDERKGKDAEEVRASAVLFAAINGLTPDLINSSDDGVRSRMLHIKTKKVCGIDYQNKVTDAVPHKDKNRTNGFEAMCAQIAESAQNSAIMGFTGDEVIGAYIVSCCVAHVQATIEQDERALFGTVERLRKQHRSNLMADSSVNDLGKLIGHSAALCLNYLKHTGKINAEQESAILSEKLDCGQLALGSSQVGFPLYLVASIDSRMISPKTLPSQLTKYTQKQFAPRDTAVADLKSDYAVKAITGSLSRASAGKSVSDIISGFQSETPLPDKLVKMQQPISDELRLSRSVYEKLEPESAARAFEVACGLVVNSSKAYNSPAGAEANKCSDIAAQFLNIIL